MGNYRAVVRHVRYWRGIPQKWSTVYQYGGVPSIPIDNGDAEAVLTADDNLCWGLSPADGGTYGCDIYNQVSGGVPIASVRLFDPEDTGAWPGFSGGAWGGGTLGQLSSAETALQIEWAAGLSSSGKPVKLRKWIHAVQDTGAQGPAVDLDSSLVTSLTVGANLVQHALGAKGLSLQSASGRLAGEAVVLPHYGNHQMPKGRKRKALVSSSGRVSFPASLLTVPGSDGSLLP